MGLPMRPGELHPFVVGWHRCSASCRWRWPGTCGGAFGEDTTAFVRHQLDELADDLLLPVG
jgi:hypothetical protein